jgi:polysaccharide chain length determinant protein (PEP-CTERM system associated)
VGNSVFKNLHNLLSGAWRRRYLIAIPILVMPIIGGIIGGLAPKKYENHTTILIQETAKLNPFMEDLSVSTNLKERMAALKTLLHSRHVLIQVGQDIGKITDTSSQKDREGFISEISAAVSVSLSGNDLLKLSLRSNQPNGMKQTLQAIKKQFISQLLAPEKSSISGSENFLAQQLELNRNNLVAAESALAQFKTIHAGSLPGLHNGNVSRLRQLTEDIARGKTELAGAKAALQSMRNRLSQTNPVVGKLEEQIVVVMGDLALLRARYTDHHSRVQGNLRKLRRLKEERNRLLNQPIPSLSDKDMERLWNRVASMTDNQEEMRSQPMLVSQLQTLQQAQTRIQKLTQEVVSMEQLASDLNSKVLAFGSTEQELSKLERDLSVKTKLYEDLLNRFEKARVTGALGRFEGPERIKVIDRPFTPVHTSNLPIILFIIGGLIGGISLGCGMAIIAEMADTTIRRKDILEKLIAAPVLSRIPPLS